MLQQAEEGTALKDRKRIVKPPIKEPACPSSSLELPLNPIHHPTSAYVNLIYIPRKEEQQPQAVYYEPTVTVKVQGPKSGTCSSSYFQVARALINISSTISLVSPSLLARLEVVPIKLETPLAVYQKINGPFRVDSFTILQIGSFYHPSYSYHRVFYVADCSFYKVQLASERARQFTDNYHIPLSNELVTAAERLVDLDLLIGWDQFPLTGLELIGVSLSPQAEMNVIAYYTHFGYTLCGAEKEKEQDDEEDEILEVA